MNKYTIYCTPEQTKKAFELSAPINVKWHYTGGSPEFYQYAENPTAEQMIGWLEEFENIDYIAPYKKTCGWDYRICTTGSLPDITSTYDSFYESRKEATLAAIDAALEYLSNSNK